MRVWSRLAEAIDRHGRAAMVTLLATEGSAPREAGARLVVHPDGAFSGTIGGGTLEWRAIAMAQAALHEGAARSFQRRSFALGPVLGQCCGGRVELGLEVLTGAERPAIAALAAAEERGSLVTAGRVGKMGIEREPTDRLLVAPGLAVWRDGVLYEGFGEEARALYLFGAGHVGRAMVLALAPLPFAVTWIDPRPDAFPSHVPANVGCVPADDPPALLAAAPAEAFVLVMTHSHPLDLSLVRAALVRPFPYVGLIGSASKRARFRSQLADAGVPAERIAAMVCPIGVAGIRSKLPAAIAAATAAELLIRDEALRGAVADPPAARQGIAG
jgi:xanthine dehydrogenase accessory factor